MCKGESMVHMFVDFVQDMEDASNYNREVVLQGTAIDLGVLLGSIEDVCPERDWSSILAYALIQNLYCKDIIGEVERSMYFTEVEEGNVEEVTKDLVDVFGGV